MRKRRGALRLPFPAVKSREARQGEVGREEGSRITPLGTLAEAERKFGEAERLCTGSDYRVCVDVASARGALEMQRGRYAQAQLFFERVLPPQL